MARIVLNETVLTPDADVNTAAAGVYQAATADGFFLEATGKAGTLILHFKNTNAATRDVTLVAGSGDDVGPAWRAVLGDLVFTLAVTTGEEMLFLTDTARFAQSDGRVHINFSAATNVTVAAFRLG